jgi:Glyoxalase/Bleomycin resistance protein/Dioxygenase superfamily
MISQGPIGITASFWHTGVVVTHLEQAMAELAGAVGAEWLPIQERPDGENVVRVTFSQTAPYLELIEGNTGGRWPTSAGPRLDHLAYWTDAFEAECSNIAEMGLHREAGGTSPWGGNWAYFRLRAAGIRVELCDTAGRDAFFERWKLTG